MKKKAKVSKVVWFDETEERLPSFHCYTADLDVPNRTELCIWCSLTKPKQNAKKIRITVEEV